MNKKILFIGAVVVVAFSFHAIPAAHAATMSFVSSESSASIGDTIDVSVRVDSDGQTVNAAQGTIQYPVDILQVVSVDDSNSIFNVWATPPSVNTSTGAISFLGGSTNSFSGTSLYVLDVTFVVKGTGTATLDFTNAGVTAGDGTGADILDGTTPLSINVNGAGTPSAVPVPGLPNTGTASGTIPQPVTRVAVPAAGLPAAPVLTVPLYPDPTRWYNQLGDTIVLWNVPTDITQVSASINHTESNVIGTPEATLSNGQDFGILQDGIWYVTVRFRNNVGWGPPAYYKISIDTGVPLPFTTQIENAGTDDPSPTIQFETSDNLSGIADYTIAVDGTVIATTTSTTMTLPPQSPGTHTLVVTAIDLAGNSVQDSTTFQILPLPTPQITFVEPSVIQGAFAFASGNGTPSSSVEVVVVDASNREVFDGTAPVDSDGNWDIAVKVPLAIGKYFL
ncbi:MAG TPA: cohesin domain-containing protein, partial [Candidatus Paceibacterota bacterium]|nr:cohesin domain-containing protein [Candidatus Paceibacterota bacterium]